MTAVIQAEGLGKRYRRGAQVSQGTLRDTLTNFVRAPLTVLHRPQRETFWALEDVSLRVHEGEVLGLIGRNGAGKTTLLKILSRITRPTTGWAEIRGRVRSMLEVGTGFHGELSGRENTYLSGSILGMSRREIDRKFDEIVAFADIEKFIDTPVKHYSSGMYVRLAFAVAAHLEPEILLVDEVLAVGDAVFQRKCLGKMNEVAGEGRTIVFVSHNMLAVQSIARRCLLMEGGQMACEGDVNAVVQRYLTKGLSELPGVLDTTEWRRPEDLGGDLRVIQVRLCSVSGQARVQTRSHLIIELDMKVKRRVQGVAYGFSIYSLDGLKLFQCINTNTDKPYPFLEPGKYRVRAEVPSIPLPPGRYRLDVGVRGESKGLDWLQELMLFEVEESKIPENLWFQGQDGLFRQASTWGKPQLIR
jgi:lipopolysaccharide transport system ATP-binding protein